MSLIKKVNVIFYIYKTINLISGKYYIGKRSFNGNSIDDDKYLGSGTLLKLAIKKYGRNNFKKEILEICTSNIELSETEKKYINTSIINDENSYNIALGGFGGNLGNIVNEKLRKICQSKEYREKMSQIINSPCVKNKISTSIKTTMSDITWKENFSKIQRDTQNKIENRIRNSERQKVAQLRADVVNKKSARMTELFSDENFKNKHKCACQTTKFRNKHREQLLGKRWINNGVEHKYVSDNEYKLLIETGWESGMLKRKK